jgi:hypothetical protein
MRRVLTLAATAAVSLFAMGGVAQAEPPAPDQTLPPTFAPPAPAPVVDVATAEAFAEGYVARNSFRFLDSRRSRTRTIDANAACLQHPVIATRFGCVFTLRALVIERARGWHGYPSKSGPPKRRRVRIRQFGCLGALTINGGPTATPNAVVRFVECARVPRGDYSAPEPEPVS